MGWKIGQAIVNLIKRNTEDIETKVDTSLVDIAAVENKVDAVEVNTINIEAKVDTSIVDTGNIEPKVDTSIIDIGTVSGKVDAVKVDTVNIESKVDVVSAETQKIDSLATNGLAGTYNSLAYRVSEIEKHFHNREKWFGLAAAPSGETHRADRMSGAVSPFTLTAGDSAFGDWVQLLGSSDTPVSAGAAYFDAHRFLITSTNSTNAFIVQVIGGESADFADKLLAEEFTESPYISASNNNDSGIEDIMTIRVAAGTKVWARCACVGANGTTLNLYFGIHEYLG